MGYSIEASRDNFDKIVLEIKQMKEIERELTIAERLQLNHKIKIAVAIKYKLTKEGRFNK